MALYFFHVELDDGQIVRDLEGEERRCVDDARTEAAAIARDLLRDGLVQRLDPQAGTPRVLIADCAGSIVGSVGVLEAISAPAPVPVETWRN